MIPGELLAEPGELELNVGRPTITLVVANTGDRPIQVGSHYHFHETNAGLAFDREAARGYRACGSRSWVRPRWESSRQTLTRSAPPST